MPDEEINFDEQEDMHVHFLLPHEQDRFDACMDGEKLREIIIAIDGYLSLADNMSTFDPSNLRNFIHKSIKDFEIKCIAIVEDYNGENTRLVRSSY